MNCVRVPLALHEILWGYRVNGAPAVFCKKASGISLETTASVLNPLQLIGDIMVDLSLFTLSIGLSTLSSGIPEKPG